MMIIFFSGLHLVTLKALQPGPWFNQEYFTDENLPGIINEGRRISPESSEELFPCTSTIPCLIAVKSRPMNLLLQYRVSGSKLASDFLFVLDRGRGWQNEGRMT
jgi:hypothetical protein